MPPSPLSSVLRSHGPPSHPSCGSCSGRGSPRTSRPPPALFSLEQQHLPLAARRWWRCTSRCFGDQRGPTCRWGAALLQTRGTQKGHFSSLIRRGVRELGCRRPDLRRLQSRRRRRTLGMLHVLQLPPGLAGPGGLWLSVPGGTIPGVGGGRVAPCTASSVPASSAQPVEVSSAGAAAASHRLFLQRHLPRGSVLAEVTSPRPVPCTALEGGMKPRQSCSGRFP